MARSALIFGGSLALKTHCILNHEFTPENTTVYKGARRCHACLRIKQRQYNLDLKLKALAGYGGKCMWPGCEISDPDMLTCDHVFDDGADERRKLDGRVNERGSALIPGGFIWRLVIKLNFPKKYQILCSNHQMKKELMRRRAAAQ